MVLSHSRKFIFFSNPKTGSESVRALLSPYADVEGVPFWEISDGHPFYSHISPPEVAAICDDQGWDFDSYFKFTFTRNPWARLVSLYRMIYERKRRFLPRPSFPRWLRGTSPDGPGGGGPADQRWRVYGTYSVGAYTGGLVDQVIRLEDIETELPKTLSRLGLGGETTIPKVNVRSGSVDYTAFYDAKSVELVRQRYREDIATYNYSFGA